MFNAAMDSCCGLYWLHRNGVVNKKAHIATEDGKIKA